MTPDQLVERLDAKMSRILSEVERSEVYRLVASPDTSQHLVVAVVRSILLEVFSYGPHVTEATFTAVGRLPKDRPDLMRPMILHDLEEVDHGEMALRDYLRLGGSEAYARRRRITPASLALGATCRMLAEREDPFSYLGYMYLLEGLTPILAERARELLARRGYPAEARHFIDVHALEDVGHARTIRDLILRVAGEYPGAAEAIEYGFDCFACTYPLPIWAAALEHAKREVSEP